MLDLIALIIIASFAYLIVGYLTVKITIYGGLATIGVYLSYLIIPGLRASEVAATMWPRWVDLWTLYFRLIDMMMAQGGADHGLAGTVVYGIVIISLALPYFAGAVFALLTWPELILLKLL